MPKLSPVTAMLRTEKLLKGIKKHKTQKELAKAEGVHQTAISKRIRSNPILRNRIQKFLNSDALDVLLVEVGADGLQATKEIAATILVDKDGKIIRAENEGAIQVKDFHARHKYWRDFMIMKKYLNAESNNGVNVKDSKVIIIHSNGHDKTILSKIRNKSD